MSDQTTFRAALLDPSHPVPPDLFDGAGNPAGARFSVYRNNVATSLTEALEQTFPILRKLIGDDTFKALAGIYLRAHPPTSPILSTYGENLPAFLEAFEPLAHLGYLPDMARLERALVKSYHAADAPPLDPAIFTAIAPEDLPRLALQFAPAVILLRSRWPIHGIWRFNTETDAPKPPHTAQDVLITRPDYDPVPQLLPAGAADFITALNEGQTLGQAAENATNFDLSALLTLLFQTQALTHATLEDQA
ncbi:DNA-binding domain-containing protein [Rhodobacteraceae bacterium LMO-12]|nr:DNA-binding domain-containing protein [Rhodobacteraceae bacterium LMO-JJ12]